MKYKFGVVSKTRPIGIDKQGNAIWMDRNGIITTKPKTDSCEICGEQCNPVFDHCHKTNRFRGWICSPCNRMLGFARDKPDVLRKAADYLEAFVATNDCADVHQTTHQEPVNPIQSECSGQTEYMECAGLAACAL